MFWGFYFGFTIDKNASHAIFGYERRWAMQNLDAMPVWVRKAPPWVLSGVFHLILALVATVLVFTEAPAEAREAKIRPSPRDRTDWRDETLPQALEQRPRIDWEEIRPNPIVPLDTEKPVVPTPEGNSKNKTDKQIRNDEGLNDPHGLGGISSGAFGDVDGDLGRVD
ncbi:MAG: hypothetical protein O6952_00880, partial [Planctomycetota bacterium]|nr:hypothetical protein [Planctomycetota bacterium]